MVYKKLMENEQADSHTRLSSSTEVRTKTWKAIWRGAAIPKVKQFLWKCCAWTLPVVEELHNRGIPIDPTCHFCGVIETIDHALDKCEWTSTVWFGGIGVRWEPNQEPTWVEWMNEVYELADSHGEEGERIKTWMVSIEWEIWKGRCDAKFKGEKTDLRGIVE